MLLRPACDVLYKLDSFTIVVDHHVVSQSQNSKLRPCAAMLPQVLYTPRKMSSSLSHYYQTTIRGTVHILIVVSLGFEVVPSCCHAPISITTTALHPTPHPHTRQVLCTPRRPWRPLLLWLRATPACWCCLMRSTSPSCMHLHSTSALQGCRACGAGPSQSTAFQRQVTASFAHWSLFTNG